MIILLKCGDHSPCCKGVNVFLKSHDFNFMKPSVSLRLTFTYLVSFNDATVHISLP